MNERVEGGVSVLEVGCGRVNMECGQCCMVYG